MIPFPPEDRRGRRLLFTPGPLTTSDGVRRAMLDDIGSWDVDCIELVRDIRTRLVELAAGEDLTCTLLQGSGSYAVEAILGSAVGPDEKVLILKNGAYGQRMALICEALHIPFVVHGDPEDTPHDPAALDRLLEADSEIRHVALVHCETTTGVLNPLAELSRVVERHGRRLIIDAISTFGGYPCGAGQPIDFSAGPIDHLAGSANKCVEGTPGFGFIISRRSAVEAAAGKARSLSLDLHAQWAHFERTGQFRFTPPTHVLLAFQKALDELAEEGGVEARAARYRKNHEVLVEGMARLGFRPLLAPEHQSHIITSFHYPEAGFDFSAFYRKLHGLGHIIYPGKLTDVDTFRIGNIGRLGVREIEALLTAIASVRGAAGR